MIDHDLLYRIAAGKRPFLPGSEKYDVLLSAFNLSDRVQKIFELIPATQKCWVIHNEYAFTEAELPKTGKLLQSDSLHEGEFIADIFNQLDSPLTGALRLCIDVTGFMRAHIMFLMHYLKAVGVESFDMLYTEPSHYARRADTVFSIDVTEVRQVNGFEGAHAADVSNDLLIVGVGYDHPLITNVIANKSNAKLIQLLSLPSLSADMYQESVVRLQKVGDAPFRVPDEFLAYASANDPFVTYMVLDEAIAKFSLKHSAPTNIYLSSLATKPQAVGFAMYYIDKLSAQPSSIVMPFAKKYSKETGTGVGRSWVYPITWIN
jgi:hypothetical protein